MSERPAILTAANVMGTWRDDVLMGKPPVLYQLGKGPLRQVEVGPGLVTLIGRAPGAGKTAFTMQGAIGGASLGMGSGDNLEILGAGGRQRGLGELGSGHE